jgi:hypothetical protein
MKKLLVMAVLLSLGLLVAGCQKDATGPSETGPTGVTNELEAMKYYALNDEFVANDEVTLQDQAVENFEYGTFGLSKTDAAIIPVRWGRFISSVTKTVTTQIAPGDTIAYAVVEKTIAGVFKIRGKMNPTDTTLVEIQKPFVDVSKRNVIFRRVAKNRERFWLNWVPVASSLVAGGTAKPAQAVRINAVQFVRGTGDTLTITNPLEHYMRYRWLNYWLKDAQDNVVEVAAGSPVRMRVVVTSAEKDTDFVFLRFGFTLVERRRLPLECVAVKENGDGTYTRVFQTYGVKRLIAPAMHFHRGYFHLTLDAMTRSTLFSDDTNTYAVSWWGVPYRVL